MTCDKGLLTQVGDFCPDTNGDLLPRSHPSTHFAFPKCRIVFLPFSHYRYSTDPQQQGKKKMKRQIKTTLPMENNDDMESSWFILDMVRSPPSTNLLASTSVHVMTPIPLIVVIDKSAYIDEVEPLDDDW
jgi:hypothetical protein